MKNGSKFEAHHHSCLPIGPILSNPWKWQAKRGGQVSKLILAMFQQF